VGSAGLIAEADVKADEEIEEHEEAVDAPTGDRWNEA
jgi:hypothetical protein